MPIIDVTVVGDAPADKAACADLARAIGQALGATEGTVWVMLNRRPEFDYAENGPSPSPPPVFVRVLVRGTGRSAHAARSIAAAVAATLDRPSERVHIIFEPDAEGRVYFGGEPGRS
jgi:phenylpyruvate tautomerase PptA (4-oxalocrotonate tautomerase family)